MGHYEDPTAKIATLHSAHVCLRNQHSNHDPIDDKQGLSRELQAIGRNSIVCVQVAIISAMMTNMHDEQSFVLSGKACEPLLLLST